MSVTTLQEVINHYNDYENESLDLSNLTFGCSDEKFEVVESDSIKYKGRTLYRIRALRDGEHFDAGDLGGYVENESNLSQYGNSWIAGEAKVMDDAIISGDAIVTDKCVVCEGVEVTGNSYLQDRCQASGEFIIDLPSQSNIGGKSIITKKPICLNAFDYYCPVVTDKHMTIGCQTRTLKSWVRLVNQTYRFIKEHGCGNAWLRPITDEQMYDYRHLLLEICRLRDTSLKFCQGC